MNYSDNLQTFVMSPSHFSPDSDAIDVRHQFPMNNDSPDSHSVFDQPPPFKRARTFDNSHSNALPCPPRGIQHQQNPPPNRGTSHIFFKTRLCAKFRTGSCRNGENCNFAHGMEDMRQPPPNWQELVGLRTEEKPPLSGNWEDDQKIILKMRLCKKYNNNNGEECPYGDKCTFLHEDPSKFRDDPGRFRESSAISIGTIGSPKSYVDNPNNAEGNNRAVNTGSNISRVNGKSTYWKTKLCVQWETTGDCTFREKCHFAHGQGELQVPGGHIEAEIVGAFSHSTKAAVPTLPKALSVSANDATATYAASLPPVNEDEQAKKQLQKWKVTKKINQIYGDWIDDLPLVIPNGVET